MKTWTKIILSLALLLNPLAGVAATKKERVENYETVEATAEQKAAAFKIQAEFDKVTYDLENINDVLIDLEYSVATGAKMGMGKKAVAEIYRRFAAGKDMLEKILNDKDALAGPLRDDLIRQLTVTMGYTLQSVLFHQKDDTKENPKTVQDGLVKVVGKEFMFDFMTTFKITVSKFGERTWGPVDRYRRDTLSQQVISEVTELAEGTLMKLNVEDEEIRKGRGYWMKKVDQSIALRNLRLTAQRVTAATYLGLSFAGLFFPVVDIFGLMDGGWSENSLFASSVVYASVWMVLGSLKLGSTSTKTLKVLAELKEILTDPKVIEDGAIPKAEKNNALRNLLTVAKEQSQIACAKAVGVVKSTMKKATNNSGK